MLPFIIINGWCILYTRRKGFRDRWGAWGRVGGGGGAGPRVKRPAPWRRGQGFCNEVRRVPIKSQLYTQYKKCTCTAKVALQGFNDAYRKKTCQAKHSTLKDIESKMLQEMVSYAGQTDDKEWLCFDYGHDRARSWCQRLDSTKFQQNDAKIA
jgi:hypothetical protein